jgi:hypothetical protein
MIGSRGLLSGVSQHAHAIHRSVGRHAEAAFHAIEVDDQRDLGFARIDSRKTPSEFRTQMASWSSLNDCVEPRNERIG